MLTDAQLSQVTIILVRARNPANIGAVARGMHDFGFSSLRVVNEFMPPLEAAKSAVDASEVIAAAQTFPTVAEAVADCTLVIGTTAVGERALRHELLKLPEAAPRIRDELANETARVAILFGSEKTGLSNEELSHCQWLLTIPMHEHAGMRHASMNLGQAAAVCLWELVREAAPEQLRPSAESLKRSQVRGDSPARPDPVPSGSLERITELFNEVIEKSEYTRRHASNSDPIHIRRLVRRIGIDAIDAPIWMGILRQILWKLNGGRE
jgi:tRNA/rRNA methyltransferase